MAYACEVLADSLSPNQVRLTTLKVTYPRFVHAELMTHRVLSRNSSSSRAIPVEKMIAAVVDDPVLPVYWGKNQKGMQAEEELSEDLRRLAQESWLLARDEAVASVRQILQYGVHKQITNRLLEPWMWITVIVTATEWENFFALRCNKDAQPELRRAADLMRASMAESLPAVVSVGDWHLPLVDWDALVDKAISPEDLPKVSAARCARVSYLTHDGKRDPVADLALYERLTSSGHMSPLEHPATPMEAYQGFVSPARKFHGNFRGWHQLRKTIPHEDVFNG